MPEVVEAVLAGHARAGRPRRRGHRSRAPTGGRCRSSRPRLAPRPAATRPSAPRTTPLTAVRLRRPAPGRPGPAGRAGLGPPDGAAGRRGRRPARAEVRRRRPGRRGPRWRGLEAFAADALARGHEGVVVKADDAPYAMGRRGAGWVKVKPVHTLDLVVLAAEWGHGRRTGRLSNLHLGALRPRGPVRRAGRLRDARQDVQGPDRRAARLADRAPCRPIAGRPDGRLGGPGPARARRRDRPRRRADLAAIPGRVGPAVRPGGALPAGQARRPRPTPSTPSGRCRLRRSGSRNELAAWPGCLERGALPPVPRPPEVIPP